MNVGSLMSAEKTLWLMGPTSSGKTTIAVAAIQALRDRGVPAIHFDGDEVRDFFGAAHGFAPEDRLRVVKALVHLANKSMDAGLTVIVSALTANPDARAYVREHTNNLLMGYVSCSIEKCIERDPKGLYGRAQRGEIDTLIGFNTPYPPLDAPDLVLDTENNSLDVTASETVEFLMARS